MLWNLINSVIGATAIGLVWWQYNRSRPRLRLVRTGLEDAEGTVGQPNWACRVKLEFINRGPVDVTLDEFGYLLRGGDSVPHAICEKRWQGEVRAFKRRMFTTPYLRLSQCESLRQARGFYFLDGARDRTHKVTGKLFAQVRDAFLHRLERFGADANYSQTTS